MKKSAPPERKTPLKKRNAKRAKSAFEKAFRCKARVEYLNSGASYVSGRYGTLYDPVQNAHYKKRSGGGNYLKVIPMLQSEHREQEEDKHYFEKRGLDPVALAARAQASWERYAEAHGIDP
jgi:hypothetical protein